VSYSLADSLALESYSLVDWLVSVFSREDKLVEESCSLADL